MDIASTTPLRARLQPSISCVVPCLNEAANLSLLLPQLVETLSGCVERWEIVVVDDGSRDGSAALLAQWAERPGIRTLQLSRNFGKEAALTAGLAAARGDVVVTLDADLQHPPEMLPTLLQHWRRGADVVYAVRTNRDDETWPKRAGTRLFYKLVNAGERVQVPEDAGDFRLMDRAAVDALLAMPERNRFLKGMYAWVGFDAVGVPYTPPPRASGRSRFDAWRLVGLSLDGITAFTTWPLRAVSVVGFLFALLGFGYGGFLSVSYLLEGNPVSGWTTIVVGMLVLFGMLMISLGIVGEYVGRVFEEVKARPLYIVKREFGRGLRDRTA